MSTSQRVLRRTLTATTFLAVLLSACTGSGSPASATGSPGPTTQPSPSDTPVPTTTPVSVLLEVTSEGGFINPSARLAALPSVVVYDDGRILMPAAPPSDGSSPLLATLSVRDVGVAGAAAMVAAIQAAGLDKAPTGDPGINADAGVSIFNVSIGGVRQTTKFAAGGPAGPGLPGGGGDNPERTAAFDLLARLTDSTDAWGADSAPETPYSPVGYRIYAAPGAPPSDPSTSVPAIPWPLASTLADFGTAAVPDLGVTGLRSGVALGADAQALGPVLAAAAAGSPFSSGGTTYTLWARPLLPHEVPA